MPIEFRCTRCNKLLRTGDDTAGKQAKCPECGTVMPIPSSVPGFSPAVAGGPAPGGYGSAGAYAPPESTNPYQSPTSLAPEPVAFAPAGEIRPTQVDFGQVFSRTWAIFSERWAPCVGATLIWLLIIFVANGIQQAVLVASRAGNKDLAVIIAIQILVQFVFQVFAIWLMLGVQLFMLSICRGEEARFGLLFAGGRYLLPAVLCNLLVQLIVVAPAGLVVVACLAGGMPLFTAILCGIPLTVFPGWIFAMMFLQAQFLIIDRNAGVVEAMGGSRDVMAGNKLIAFAVLLVAGILAGLFTLLTCFTGALAAAPYMMILTAVLYLGVTGQPTMLDRHVSYAGTYGPTPSGQGGTPFGA